MSEHKLMTTVGTPALVGGIAGLETQMIFEKMGGYPEKIKWRNQSYDAALVAGAANAAGCLGAELFHEYVFPMIPGHEKWSEPVSLGVAVGAQTLVNIGVHQYLNSGNMRNIGLGNLAIVSATSYLLGSGIMEKFILPVSVIV